MSEMPELSDYTETELAALCIKLQKELQRRQAPDRLASLFADYAAQGGDCLALADQAQRLASEHPGPDDADEESGEESILEDLLP